MVTLFWTISEGTVQRKFTFSLNKYYHNFNSVDICLLTANLKNREVCQIQILFACFIITQYNNKIIQYIIVTLHSQIKYILC